MAAKKKGTKPKASVKQWASGKDPHARGDVLEGQARKLESDASQLNSRREFTKSAPLWKDAGDAYEVAQDAYEEDGAHATAEIMLRAVKHCRQMQSNDAELAKGLDERFGDWIVAARAFDKASKAGSDPQTLKRLEQKMSSEWFVLTGPAQAKAKAAAKKEGLDVF